MSPVIETAVALQRGKDSEQEDQLLASSQRDCNGVLVGCHVYRRGLAPIRQLVADSKESKNPRCRVDLVRFIWN
ncbi:hypothetical protein BHE74_00043310 [Ensete ventricosum]|nr:hypothetical protein BHE74_00043310 [Ensete ventricosum]